MSTVSVLLCSVALCTVRKGAAETAYSVCKEYHVREHKKEEDPIVNSDVIVGRRERKEPGPHLGSEMQGRSTMSPHRIGETHILKWENKAPAGDWNY